MEKIIYKTGEGALIILCILFLGNLVPTVISMSIAICSEETFSHIITTSVPYWIGTIIGWVVAGIYINDAVTED